MKTKRRHFSEGRQKSDEVWALLLTTVDGQSLKDQPGSYFSVTAEDDDDVDRTKTNKKSCRNQEMDPFLVL